MKTSYSHVYSTYVDTPSSSDVIIVIYENGEIKLDSSNMKYDENYFGEFQLNGSLNVEALAAYIFVDYKA